MVLRVRGAVDYQAGVECREDGEHFVGGGVVESGRGSAGRGECEERAAVAGSRCVEIACAL